MTKQYTLIEKNDNKEMFYASIIVDSLLIISKKQVVCCGNGFSDKQAMNLINIHYNRFCTGQKTDNEVCQSPK
jgi:phosphoheptose isomerase